MGVIRAVGAWRSVANSFELAQFCLIIYKKKNKKKILNHACTF